MAERAAVSAKELKTVRSEIDGLGGNIVVIPEGFPGAEDVRQNIEAFLKRNATKVAHLIMVIHEE